MLRRRLTFLDLDLIRLSVSESISDSFSFSFPVYIHTKYKLISQKKNNRRNCCFSVQSYQSILAINVWLNIHSLYTQNNRKNIKLMQDKCTSFGIIRKFIRYFLFNFCIMFGSAQPVDAGSTKGTLGQSSKE